MQKKIQVIRILVLLCSLVLLLSAAMTGTYAWQSNQQANNIANGNEVANVPVELIKFEKQIDGTETENPIEGTVFYLYKETGEQVGGRYVTDENGKINTKVAIGDYYFEEEVPSVGFTYDTDNEGKTIKKYSFSATEENKKVTVTAYNKRLAGSLVISKTVQNRNGTSLTEVQKNTSFEFTVTFSDEGSYVYKVDGGEGQLLESGESLYLKHGQTAVFEKLPAGIVYDVVEKPVDGYSITSSGHRGNVVENGRALATFVNYYGEAGAGSLTIAKTVKGENADKNKSFSFIAIIDGEPHEFTLKHNEKKVFSGLRAGTEYSVIEGDASKDGYISTNREYTGQVAGGANIVLPFVNVYEPSTEGKTGALTVRKSLMGSNADINKTFTFKVTFMGAGAPPAETFSLKANETKTIDNIPSGVMYTVAETDSGGYVPIVESAKGTIASTGATVAFVNDSSDVTSETVELTVKKVLAGEYLESHKNRTFNITLTVDGKTTPLQLKANETLKFDVPRGAVYEISEEDYIKEGFSQSIVNGSGMATQATTNVVVTNTYVGEPVVEISGVKTWDLNGEKDLELPKSIVVKLKNDGLIIDKQEVKPEGDKWAYTFVAAKYNADGSLAKYSIEEEPVENFRATYNGYNIVNKYVKPVKVDPPIITKVVEGENASTTLFEFVFKGEEGNPMPEGSDGQQKVLTLNGEGELEIGTIAFDKVGTYIYTVHEKDGQVDGWTYDASVYTITIVVTEEENELKAERTIIKNDTKADEIVFKNIFDHGNDKTVKISGMKIWNHGSNAEKNRPTSIVVKVIGDSKLVVQRQVTAKDNWCYSFEVPRFNENGKEILYIIDEEPIKNYQKMTDGYNLVNVYIGPPPVPGDTSNPSTGEDTHLMMWIAIMIASMSSLIILKIAERKLIYAGKSEKRKR